MCTLTNWKTCVPSNPGVLECAAVGFASEATGEGIRMYVVKSDPELTEEAVIAYMREQVTAYKVPNPLSLKMIYPKPMSVRSSDASSAMRQLAARKPYTLYVS